MRVTVLVSVLVPSICSGCQCRDPAIPTVATSATDTDQPPTPDTDPEPPCDWPESEPNNTELEADVIPLEGEACGAIQVMAGESDVWSVQLNQSAWVGIEVDALELGSLLDPTVLVSVDATPAFGRIDDPDGGDVHLLVPMEPADLDVRVFSLDGGEADRWFYDLLVTVQKAPVVWDDTELEPPPPEGQSLGAEVSMFGVIDGNDEDRFRLDVPPGRHQVRLWIEAFDFGSPLDASLQLVGTETPCVLNSDCRFDAGITGAEADPVANYNSAGDESFEVVVSAEDQVVLPDSSPFHWYVLHVELEAAQ